MTNIKFRKKITVQLIVIVSIFMMIMHAVSLIVLVNTSEKMYTKAKNELITLNMKHASEVLDPTEVDPETGELLTYGIGPVSFLEYCADHVSEVMIPIDDDDEEAWDILGDIYDKYSQDEGDPPLKHFSEFTETEKSIYSRSRYVMIENNIADLRANYSSPSLAVICKGKDGSVTVVSSDAQEGLPASFLADVVTAEYKSNKTLDNLVELTKDGEPEYKVVDADDGSWYVSYLPIYTESDYHFAVVIVNDFRLFRNTLVNTVVWVVVGSTASFLFVVVFLIFFLYRRTAKPVKQIQGSVRAYKATKDTKQVVAELNRVKVNNEFGMLASDVADLAVTMQQYNEENVKFAADAERISTELDLAMKIQMSTLPIVKDTFKEHEHFDLAASMKPAKEVGGDFYDFFPIDDKHICLIVADVSGKGVPAALFMMMVKMQIQSYAKTGMKPSKVLESVNKAICQNNKENMFVTVWLGILDVTTGKVVASNAGHEHPVIKSKSGKYSLFEDNHGAIIGAFIDSTFPEYEFKLDKGGTLFLYTDGLTEATNANNELFKVEGMLKSLNSCKSTDPTKILEHVHKDVDKFVGEAPQFDDLTMLAVTLN